jgi:hypothetical protein
MTNTNTKIKVPIYYYENGAIGRALSPDDDVWKGLTADQLREVIWNSLSDDMVVIQTPDGNFMIYDRDRKDPDDEVKDQEIVLHDDGTFTIEE